MRALLLTAIAVVLLQPVVGGTDTPAHASSTAVPDAGAAAEMGSALNAARAELGREPLFSRSSFRSNAQAVANALAEDRTPPAVPEGMPMVSTVLSVPTANDITEAARQLASRLSGPLNSPYYTDTGWAAATTDTGYFRTVSIVAIVGLPAAPVTRNSACTASGFCWSYRGLHPHAPWTRNQVRWLVSTSGLPSGGAAVVRDGAARINRVSGLGADTLYGGTTSATTWSTSTPFLVVFGNSCRAAGAVACAEPMTVGSTELLIGTRIIIMRDRYLRSASNRDYWVGTVAHEIAHALGLGHYDGAYGGRLQMMHSSRGPNSPQAGDVNGLRALAPAGAVYVSPSLQTPSVRVGGRAYATVRGTSTGLGGLRAFRVDCLDARNAWRVVAQARGTWDIRPRAIQLSWPVGWTPRTQTCRAVVQSKARTASSPWFRVTIT